MAPAGGVLVHRALCAQWCCRAHACAHARLVRRLFWLERLSVPLEGQVRGRAKCTACAPSAQRARAGFSSKRLRPPAPSWAVGMVRDTPIHCVLAECYTCAPCGATTAFRMRSCRASFCSPASCVMTLLVWDHRFRISWVMFWATWGGIQFKLAYWQRRGSAPGVPITGRLGADLGPI